MDLALFFPPVGGDPDFSANNVHNGRAKDARYAEAAKTCQVCPVIVECLNWALDQPEKFGFWGGMDEDERKREKRRRSEVARKRDAVNA